MSTHPPANPSAPAARSPRGRWLVWSVAALYLVPALITVAESLLARAAPSDLESIRTAALIALAVGTLRRARLARWVGALAALAALWALGPAFLQALASGPTVDERIMGAIGLAGNLWIAYVLILSPSARAYFARSRTRAPAAVTMEGPESPPPPDRAAV